MQRQFQIILAISVGLVVITSGFFVYENFLNPINQVELNEYYYAPDFTLNNQIGESFTLSDTNGTVRVLSWIYTACVWGCSTITYKMFQAYKQLMSKGLADDITFVEIDFDYIFDNQTTLGTHIKQQTEYTASTLPSNYQFLLGDEDKITNLTGKYNYKIEFVNQTLIMDSTHSTNSSLVLNHEGATHEIEWIHSFLVYIIDTDGQIRKFISGLDWDPEEIVNAVRAILKGR